MAPLLLLLLLLLLLPMASAEPHPLACQLRRLRNIS
jgi:hypothetical protein